MITKYDQCWFVNRHCTLQNTNMPEVQRKNKAGARWHTYYGDGYEWIHNESVQGWADHNISIALHVNLMRYLLWSCCCPEDRPAIWCCLEPNEWVIVSGYLRWWPCHRASWASSNACSLCRHTQGMCAGDGARPCTDHKQQGMRHWPLLWQRFSLVSLWRHTSIPALCPINKQTNRSSNLHQYS